MANVIIGTAGHIDHGKTTLIKRLTGIETDRFEEEKKRGITIDLGFAYFDLPSGKRAGIVDVPGHEKFIRNMLAGASGMDLVLLIVSAEEGIMPQTVEHMDILTLLNVKNGIVVMTKCDLVDEDWRSLVKEEVREGISNSFLKDAPIVEVSSATGEGVEELINLIDEKVAEAEEKNLSAAPRLPIDRVFTMTGFGTVVTGTLVEGTIKEGDELGVFPSGLEAKVRNIQVHGKSVDKAYAGQRVAINLANLKKTDLHRGDTLAAQGSMNTSHMIDGKIKILESCNREIQNWTRLRLYYGTTEVFCRIVLLDKESVKPGEECYAQFRLEEETACKYGDHFVLRLYSPLETIGGGIILDPSADKHKRFKDEIINELIAKNEGDPAQLVENNLFKHSADFPKAEDIARHAGLSLGVVEDIIGDLLEGETAIQLGDKSLIHSSYLVQREEEIIRALNTYHEKQSLKPGMPKEEFRSKLFPQLKGKVFDELLQIMAERDVLKTQANAIALPHFEISFTKGQKALVDSIIKVYSEAKLTPPNTKDLGDTLKAKAKDLEVIDILIADGTLVKLGENIMILGKYYEEVKENLVALLNEHGEITLAQFRDMADTSRKVAVPLMEHFDAIKLTKRVEDKRVLR